MSLQPFAPQRRWDIASGKEVESSKIASEDAFRFRTKKYLLSARHNILRITPLRKAADAMVDACFKAPGWIASVQCHGTTICLDCMGEGMHFLHAPFLVEPNQ